MLKLLMSTSIAMLCSLTLLCVSAVAASEDVSLPERKAGLWNLKSSMDEGSGPRVHEMKLCIDAAMETNTVRASIAEHKSKCESYETSRANDVTTVDRSCKFNQRHVVSKTEMSGDFKTAFKIKIESTTSDDAANDARTITIKRLITQEGQYIGESCGDLEPGQALLPDGSKVLAQ